MNHLINSGILSRIFPKFVAATIAGKIRVKSVAFKQLINGGMSCRIFPKFVAELVQYFLQQYLREKLRSKVLQASGLWEFARSGRTTYQITPAVHVEWIIAVFLLKLWFIKALLKYGVITTIKCFYLFTGVTTMFMLFVVRKLLFSICKYFLARILLFHYTQWHCGLGRAHYQRPWIDLFCRSAQYMTMTDNHFNPLPVWQQSIVKESSFHLLLGAGLSACLSIRD